MIGFQNAPFVYDKYLLLSCLLLFIEMNWKTIKYYNFVYISLLQKFYKGMA